ncbi:hypothetical protein ACYX34_14005 [Nitrospira sp. CMX1]|nr:hypothetical protein [Nitrospira sp.]
MRQSRISRRGERHKASEALPEMGAGNSAEMADPVAASTIERVKETFNAAWVFRDDWLIIVYVMIALLLWVNVK